MAFTPTSHTPYPWEDGPYSGTPLDAVNLIAAEADLVEYTQTVGTALGAYVDAAVNEPPVIVLGGSASSTTSDVIQGGDAASDYTTATTIIDGGTL
jgi:hypothetical protein